MNVSCLRMGALAGLSAALLGCASTEPVKDATLLSSLTGKDAAKDKAAAAPGTIAVPSDIESAVRQAQGLRRSGDFPAAAKTLSQLVLIAPDDPRVLSEYSKTLIAEGRSDDALAFLERAISLQPGDWSLYSAQGVAYDQKGDYQTAQASYGRALALKPGDPTVLSNAALSHMQAGDLAGAEKLLREAAMSGAEFPRIASNLALLQSLRGAAAQQAAAQNPAEAPARQKPPAALPVRAETPVPAPAPVTASAPATPSAPVHEPAVLTAAPVVPRPTPVESAALAAPVTWEPSGEQLPVPSAGVQPVAEQAPPAESNASSAQEETGALSIEKLKADPSVLMQAVPKDSKAGPVAPPKKRAAEKPPSPPVGQTAEGPSLRPTLSETEPAKGRAAKNE